MRASLCCSVACMASENSPKACALLVGTMATYMGPAALGQSQAPNPQRWGVLWQEGPLGGVVSGVR